MISSIHVHFTAKQPGTFLKIVIKCDFILFCSGSVLLQSGWVRMLRCPILIEFHNSVSISCENMIGW